MRKVTLEDKRLANLVKMKEDYYAAHFKPLHDRSLEIIEEQNKIQKEKQPHVKHISEYAEKASKLLKKHKLIENEFEQIGQVYLEDGKVTVEVTNAVDDFKAAYLEERIKVKSKK